MKNLFVILLLFVASSAFSQSTVTLNGSIENSNGETVRLSSDKYYLGLKVDTYISVTRENKFNFSIPLDKSRVVFLSYKNNTHFIYLEPNSDLNLTIDTNNILNFTGKEGASNQFLQKFNEQFNSDFDKNAQEKKMLEQNIDAFEIDLFDAKQKQDNFIKKYPEFENLNESFKNYVRNRIAYNYWNWLLDYPAVHANSAKSKTVKAIPTILLEGLDKSKIVDQEAMICDSYRGFINSFVVYFNSEANGFNTFHDYNTAVDRKCTFAKNKLFGEPYSYFVAKQLLDYCEKMTPSFAKAIFKNFETLDKKGVYSEIAKYKCGEWMNTKDPKIEPLSEKPSNNSAKSSGDEPKYIDQQGKEIKLSTLKGKVLYVDIWASWCGPCRQQFPYSKALHEKLTDSQKKQIEFVYISIDEDTTRWKKGIEENKLEGKLLFSPGGWKSDASKYFQINSIPRYLIIDKKGKISNANAPRPSDESILNELLELIK
jgi:thiol-disulfide isomerase/thioredoxin